MVPSSYTVTTTPTLLCILTPSTAAWAYQDGDHWSISTLKKSEMCVRASVLMSLLPCPAQMRKKKISGSKGGTVAYLFLFLSAFHNAQIVRRESCDHWFLSNPEGPTKNKKRKRQDGFGYGEKTHHQRDSKTLKVAYHPASWGPSDTKEGNMQNMHVCENEKKWVWQHDWYARISFSFVSLLRHHSSLSFL